ncbi:hypothetical protein [Methanosphaera sp.]
MNQNNKIDDLTTGPLFINYLKQLGLTENDGINLRNQLYYEYNNNYINLAELEDRLIQLITKTLKNNGLNYPYNDYFDDNEKYLIYLYNQKHMTMHCHICKEVILYNDTYCHNCGEKTGYKSSNVIGYNNSNSNENYTHPTNTSHENKTTPGDKNRLYAIITYLIALDNKPSDSYRPEESLFKNYNITREELEKIMLNSNLISNQEENNFYSLTNTGLELIASNPQIFFYNKFLKQYPPNLFEELYQSHKNELSLPEIGLIFIKNYERKYVNEFKWKSYRNTLLTEYIIEDLTKNESRIETILKIFICDINPWKDNELTNVYQVVVPFICENIKKIVKDCNLSKDDLYSYFIKAVEDIKLPKLVIKEEEIFERLLNIVHDESIDLIQSEVIYEINQIIGNKKYNIKTKKDYEEVINLLNK